MAIRSLLENGTPEIGQYNESLEGRTITQRLELNNGEQAIQEIDIDRSEENLYLINNLGFIDTNGKLLDINKTYNPDNSWKMIEGLTLPMEASMASIQSDPPYLFFGRLNNQLTPGMSPLEIVLHEIGHLKHPREGLSYLEMEISAINFVTDSLRELEAAGYNFSHSPYTRHNGWTAGSVYHLNKSLPVIDPLKKMRANSIIPQVEDDEIREIEKYLGVADNGLSTRIKREINGAKAAWIQSYKVGKVLQNIKR